MPLFAKKLSARDKRRIAKNKAIKKYQMVTKTICKRTGRLVVSLGVHYMVFFRVKTCLFTDGITEQNSRHRPIGYQMASEYNNHQLIVISQTLLSHM